MSIYDPLNHDYRCLERPQQSDRSLLERALPWLEKMVEQPDVIFSDRVKFVKSRRLKR